MTDILGRRRFLVLTAAAALAPLAARAAAGPELVRWTGRALGADAELRLYHSDPASARAAIAEAVIELERLEAVFSLFRPDSALVRLNRDGYLEVPPLDLVRILEEAASVSAVSNGAFDVTVQPVWRLYADSLKRAGRMPEAAALEAARRLVDWRRVEVAPDLIRLAQPGMAITLNGIAQGYVGDRVAELLVRRGFVHTLVDMGELRALGLRGDGSPWQVAVRDPRHRTTPLRRIELGEGAMATSEALGSSFPGFGKYGHLIQPANGQPALEVPSVTVWAPTATRADALSTALAVAGPERAKAIATAAGATRSMLVAPGGIITDF